MAARAVLSASGLCQYVSAMAADSANPKKTAPKRRLDDPMKAPRKAESNTSDNAPPRIDRKNREASKKPNTASAV